MLRLVSDQNFNDPVVRGLFRRLPELDLVRVRDEGMERTKDPPLLAWAAEHGRIVLTHDRNTMPGFAYSRVTQGLPMPGVFVVDDTLPIGRAIEELEVIVMCSADDEWDNQVVFIPL